MAFRRTVPRESDPDTSMMSQYTSATPSQKRPFLTCLARVSSLEKLDGHPSGHAV
jgi:hypothetical protein